jgi:GNAT superfamily N-acetyltransferase
MGEVFASAPPREGVVVRLEDGWWAAVAGLPVADANMVLIHDDLPEVVTEAVGLLGDGRLPALLMLAGDGERVTLPPDFAHVGAMPVMTKDLREERDEHDDDRVRRASAADASVCSDLMEAAFGLPRVATDLFAEMFLQAGDWWILEEGGVPVSCVFAHRVEDSVSIWCMSTPPAHQRRGYGRALLGAALARAAADGATWGMLGATEAGYPLYEATGWSVADQWQIHVNATSEQFS